MGFRRRPRAWNAARRRELAAIPASASSPITAPAPSQAPSRIIFCSWSMHWICRPTPCQPASRKKTSYKRQKGIVRRRRASPRATSAPPTDRRKRNTEQRLMRAQVVRSFGLWICWRSGLDRVLDLEFLRPLSACRQRQPMVSGGRRRRDHPHRPAAYGLRLCSGPPGASFRGGPHLPMGGVRATRRQLGAK